MADSGNADKADAAVATEGESRDSKSRNFLLELLDRFAAYRASAWWVAFWFAAQICVGVAGIAFNVGRYGNRVSFIHLYHHGNSFFSPFPTPVSTVQHILINVLLLHEPPQDWYIMWYVLASAFFLLLWLVASGRVSLRLTTPKESARSTPAFLLWVCGLGLLAGGILMGVGERGVRARALGRRGRLSYAFDIMAPAAVVCGLFNLVLVCCIR